MSFLLTCRNSSTVRPAYLSELLTILCCSTVKAVHPQMQKLPMLISHPLPFTCLVCSSAQAGHFPKEHIYLSQLLIGPSWSPVLPGHQSSHLTCQSCSIFQLIHNPGLSQDHALTCMNQHLSMSLSNPSCSPIQAAHLSMLVTCPGSCLSSQWIVPAAR